MTPWYAVAAVAATFGCAAFGVLRYVRTLCATIVPFADGPAPGTPPTAALVAGAALVGALVAARGIAFPHLALAALVVVSLVACWAADVRTGIVPDRFTLVPLAIVLGVSLVRRDVAPFVSAALVAVPFAGAAALSKGRGMGWGDVKLVALGAAPLGVETAILALMAASLAAVTIALVRKRRTQPLAFAPYLSAALCIAIAIPRNG